MSEIKDGGPAFPVADPMGLEPGTVAEMKRLASGMTLRDYFAAHVDITKFNLWDYVFEMRSMHAPYTAEEPTADEIVAAIAHLKFKVADAMVRARGDQ